MMVVVMVVVWGGVGGCCAGWITVYVTCVCVCVCALDIVRICRKKGKKESERNPAGCQ